MSHPAREFTRFRGVVVERALPSAKTPIPPAFSPLYSPLNPHEVLNLVKVVWRDMRTASKSLEILRYVEGALMVQQQAGPEG